MLKFIVKTSKMSRPKIYLQELGQNSHKKMPVMLLG